MVSTTRISSSRATIIAGAMPPRVIATTARQPSSGASPCRRHARARASRCNWSQLTWKPFSCGKRLVMVVSLTFSQQPQAKHADDGGGQTVKYGFEAQIAVARWFCREGQREEAVGNPFHGQMIGEDQGRLRQRQAGRKDHHEDRGGEEHRFGVGEVDQQAGPEGMVWRRGRALCFKG